MERSSLSWTFTIDNGVAQSADGSLIWNLNDDESDSDYDDDDDLSIGGEEIDIQSDEDFRVFMTAVVRTLRELEAHLGGGGDEGGGSEEGVSVFVPASRAAVAGLEKQAFHATAEGTGCDCAVTGCAICLDNFEDGEEVTVMPCSRGHEFHPDCITKWLGKRNTCPLCRPALPTDDIVMEDDDGL